MKEQNKINLDYDYNTEYGDGDIPKPDKNSTKDDVKIIEYDRTENVIHDEVPRMEGPGGN